MPQSTPSNAIRYEFGLTDLDIEVEMERILLMCNMLKKTNSAAKDLLQVMLVKKIPGFCVDLIDSMTKFNLQEGDEILEKDGKQIRKHLKKEIVAMQSQKLGKNMLLESKCDRLLLNDFNFDGKPKRYLTELPFNEARVIFMLRCKMFPTKNNFQGRWDNKSERRYCSCTETDLHLFSCGGYRDLLAGVRFENFMALNVSMEELARGAKALLKVKERLEMVNN